MLLELPLGGSRRDPGWLPASLRRVSSTHRPSTAAPAPGHHDPAGLATAAYVVLFLLGVVLGLLGTFQYSSGPGVLVPILFDVAILATCVLGAWGMSGAAGGVLPAVGWLLITILLSSAPAGGSVLVTNTSSGKWFLYGGAVCAAAGAVWAFAFWSGPGKARRSRPARHTGR
jgi:Family of unknown function (DUF6113)